MKRDYLSVLDLSVEEVYRVLRLARDHKRGKPWEPVLVDRAVAMIFEKPSLRTRVTFQVAIHQLGGQPIYLAPGDIKLGVRESVEDVARNLARWVDMVVARVFSHDTLVRMAEAADIPIINALSDLEHPCQALADFLTMYERRGRLEGLKLAFVGDGNNVAISLMLLSALMGVRFTIACPQGYEPPDWALERARELGGDPEVVRDPKEAVQDADFIYTDVWTSMGQEAEAEERRRVFAGTYQVNRELLELAPPHALVMHCLPAHRGEEITDEVLDGPRSVVLDQAENRLHAQRALLIHLWGG